ncbi:hypothetical protein BG95_05785 [Thermosipho sp. 1063]|uniref:DUF4897 domain-containing protein n=1 Tax=unclassified Thermosipho (in: thermotogales) TaxID=2676525 RepID=UPI00094929B3|nr:MULTISPECIES: DUF4897 domain-containing protein [unclassified Thermosipho (in: thermotogales)]ANQ53929.1 hypothetical protein Y592_05860 [Thermosipho sp. 1070]APT72375.1 hypothetical protein BG95_05785 [Thermosipho sp. 1063]
MQNKTLFYILLFMIVAFLIFDFFTIFNRKPKFDITYYQTIIETDYSNAATITTIAGLSFNDLKEMENYKVSYTQNSSATFLDYFKKISEEIGKNMSVKMYKNSASERAGILEIQEIAVIENLVTIGNNKYTLSLGNIQINPNENSSFIVYIPKESALISAQPTPTSIIKNKLYWSGNTLKNFPTVIYGGKK